MSTLSKFTAGFILAGSLAALTPAHAQKYAVVYNFGAGTDAANPFSNLLELNGTLYGTTYYGGTSNNGSVFGLTPSGTETMLYSFSGDTDGANPYGGLTNFDGALYGTAQYGGSAGFGTLFNVTTAGVETTLHSFTGGLDGKYPEGTLTKVGPALYGTSAAGGDGKSCGAPGCGTIFKYSSGRGYKVSFRFGNTVVDAVAPLGALLNVGGELYGTSFNSSQMATPLGAVFQTDKKGAESVLHFFGQGTDGADPVGGLINVNGTFYGTTESGGDNEYGTVFSITPAGVETVLYSFKGGTHDGAGPQAALINVNGTLYGTTGNGGSKGNYSFGTVFKITLAGQETVIHKFGVQAGPDGSVPLGNLIKVGGKLYGTTLEGGANGKGTVFEITP